MCKRRGLMTSNATDGLNVFFMRKVGRVEPRVARNASEFCVRGMIEHRFIDCDGYFLPVPLHRQRFFRVALQAVLSRLSEECRGKSDSKSQPKNAFHFHSGTLFSVQHSGSIAGIAAQTLFQFAVSSSRLLKNTFFVLHEAPKNNKI
jgi:hypothetical protein